MDEQGYFVTDKEAQIMFWKGYALGILTGAMAVLGLLLTAGFLLNID